MSTDNRFALDAAAVVQQHRQNEMDRDRMRRIMTELRDLRRAVEQLKA